MNVPVKLHGRAKTSGGSSPFVVRLTRDYDLPAGDRHRHALLVKTVTPSSQLEGFAAVVTDPGTSVSVEGVVVALPTELLYLDEGDIVRIDPARQNVNVIYRRRAGLNSLLVTERCNSRCLMCSQPPIDRDDSWIVDELLSAIPLMAPDTPELAITGGEPTLLRDDLMRILTAIRDHLPTTAVHLLSNGRLFAYLPFASQVAAVKHPDLMIGIPLYSDLPDRHNFVVQAKGAFDQTLRGILNLGRYRQRVEVRVVIHAQTYQRLPHLARFIARNLPFVSQVVLMGIEMMGYTRINLDSLWIDPVDYQAELQSAVELLDQAGIPVWIYNHQLCLLDRALWRHARKSISDWKNIYMPECAPCEARDECGGFFASAALRYSDRIRPLTHSAAAPFA